MRAVKYFLEISGAVVPVHEIYGAHIISSLYYYKIKIINKCSEVSLGDKVALFFRDSSCDNGSLPCKNIMYCFYVSEVCEVVYSEPYLSLTVQPSWFHLGQFLLAMPCQFKTVKEWLDYCSCLAKYNGGNKFYGFKDVALNSPFYDELGCDAFEITQSICSEILINYTFVVGAADIKKPQEKIVFSDSSEKLSDIEDSYYNNYNNVFTNVSVDGFDRSIVFDSVTVIDCYAQVSVWSSEDWQERLYNNTFNLRSGGYIANSPNRQCFSPFNTALEVVSAGRVTGYGKDIVKHKSKEYCLDYVSLLRFINFGKPYLPGDRVRLFSSKDKLNISGVFLVYAVEFSTVDSVVRQVIFLKTLRQMVKQEENFICNNKYFAIKSWRVCHREQLDNENSYTQYKCWDFSAIDLKLSTESKVVVNKESRQAFWCNVPKVDMWTTPLIDESSAVASPGGGSTSLSNEENVLVAKVYGSIKSPIILGSVSFCAAAGPVAATASWLWQEESRQGYASQFYPATFNAYGAQSAAGNNYFCVTDCERKHHQEKTNGVSYSHDLILKNSIEVVSDSQNISYGVAGDVNSYAVDSIFFVSVTSITCNSESLTIKSDKIQSQSNRNISWFATTELNLITPSDYHHYSYKPVFFQAQEHIDINSSQLSTSAATISFKGHQIAVVALGSGGVCLQVGSSVILLGPGVIGIFAKTVNMPANTTYLGQVVRLPSAIPFPRMAARHFLRHANKINNIEKSSNFFCSDLFWGNNIFFCQKSFFLSFISMFDSVFDYKFKADFKINVYFCLLKGAKYPYLILNKKLLFTTSLLSPAGVNKHDLKVDFSGVSWRDEVENIAIRGSSDHDYGLIFSVSHMNRVWWSPQASVLRWRIIFKVYEWSAGKDKTLSLPIVLSCRERIASQSPFSSGAIWSSAINQEVVVPAVCMLRTKFYALQLKFAANAALSSSSRLTSSGASDNCSAYISSIPNVGGYECFSYCATKKWGVLGPAAFYELPKDLASYKHGPNHRHDRKYNTKSGSEKNNTNNTERFASDSQSDANKLNYELDTHVLSYPVIFYLSKIPPLAKDIPGSLPLPKPILLSPDQLSRLKLDSGNVTLFVHGYDVEFGSFSNYSDVISNIQHGDSSVCLLSPEVLGSMKSCRPFSNVLRTVLNPKTEDRVHAKYTADKEHESDFGYKDKEHATGAHKWLQVVEYYLNKVSGFDGSDYRSYKRLILISWPSVGRYIFSYKSIVRQAQYSGLQLASLLDQLKSNDLDVSIVAHSLGCGVALAAVNELYERYHKKIERVVLCEPALPYNVLSQGVPSEIISSHSSDSVPDELINSVGSDLNNHQLYIYPWFLPSLWHGVSKIIVLYSRNDNILGPITTSAIHQKGILKVKPFWTEIFLPLFLKASGVEGVYAVGASIGVPAHCILSNKAQDSICQYWRKIITHDSDHYYDFDDYSGSLKDSRSARFSLALKRAASSVDRRSLGDLIDGGKWVGDKIPGHYWSNLQSDIRVLINSILREESVAERFFFIINLLLNEVTFDKVTFPAEPALGYHGPNKNNPVIERLLLNGKLECLDTTDWVLQHSHMLYPNYEVETHVYKYIASFLPQFGGKS